jgi:hypothetical protein
LSSVFKKLLSRELGENKYNKYFSSYQKLVANRTYDSRKINSDEIYNDIYEYLKDRDIKVLTKMLERLLDAMYLAVRISKQFVFAFVFYLIGAFVLIAQSLDPVVTVPALLLMSCCIIYKTYEFVVNKYCYIDAHIVLVYKSVLDKLILNNKNGDGNTAL